jgi:hypothetical protein
MPDIDLIDRSLDLENTQIYHLSIQAELNGLSFCILDIKESKYIGLRNYVFGNIFSIEEYVNRLEEVFKEDGLLNIKYRSVSFIYLTQKSTLIPRSYFNKTDLKTYFKFNQSINELDEINYNYLSEINAYNVFAIPNYIANEAIKWLGRMKLFHQATPFIKSIFEKDGDREGDSVYVNINNKFIDIAVASKEQLYLYNTFQYQNETDLLYFVLYIYKQLNMDTQRNRLLISGEHSDNIRYYNALKKYIKSIVYLGPFDYMFSAVLDQVDKHKFLNLFNLASCE